MFCSPSSYVDSNLNNLPFPKAGEEGEFKNEQVQFSLMNSRYSLSSTIDSPEISPKYCSLLQMDMDIDENCFDFEVKGFCIKGESCCHVHEMGREKSLKPNWFEKYPELFIGREMVRRRSFLL